MKKMSTKDIAANAKGTSPGAAAAGAGASADTQKVASGGKSDRALAGQGGTPGRRLSARSLMNAGLSPHGESPESRLQPPLNKYWENVEAAQLTELRHGVEVHVKSSKYYFVVEDPYLRWR